MNRRYTFMNILRIMALAVIIGYHFLADVYQRGLCEIQHPDVHVVVGNINLVMVAVSIFFILSGCGLVLMMTKWDSHDTKSGKLVWKAYYANRFFKILIPFYITYIAYLIYKLISATAPLFEGVEWWKAIFTVMGIDEYLHMAGMNNFSLGIGEWFLGAIIMMYVVFPLLYTAMKKWKWQTFIVATIYYVIVVLTYKSDIAWYNNVFVKIYDFIVGMFLAFELYDLRVLGEKKIGDAKIPILPTLLVVVVAFAAIKMNQAFSTIIVSAGIFLIGFYLEGIVGETPNFSKAVAKICSYEYYVFLVHHCVIYLYQEPMQQARMILSKPKLIMLFGIEFVTMVLLAIAIKWIAGRFKMDRIDQV